MKIWANCVSSAGALRQNSDSTRVVTGAAVNEHSHGYRRLTVEKLEELRAAIRAKFTDAELEERARFLMVTPEDLERIKKLGRAVSADMAPMFDTFYAQLSQFSHAQALIGGRLDRLKRQQLDYFVDMLKGQLDQAYLRRRLDVAEAHLRVGVEPKWYVGAMGLYQWLAARLIREHPVAGRNADEVWAAVWSLQKLLFLDLSITIDAYFETLLMALRENEEAAQHLKDERIRELATPVIEVADFVWAVPLQGTLDLDRARATEETVLAALSGGRARALIFDITGLRAVDESALAQLVRVVQSAELLGVLVYVTGVQPEIARRLAQSELDMGSLRTKRRLADGIVAAQAALAGGKSSGAAKS